MCREERIELMAAVVAKLEEAAQLLTIADEAVLASQVDELANLVVVVATPGEDTEAAAAA
ncbi:MAG: hypothetical protein ACRD3W_21020 [Terriglobales bacterium]